MGTSYGWVLAYPIPGFFQGKTSIAGRGEENPRFPCLDGQSPDVGDVENFLEGKRGKVTGCGGKGADSRPGPFAGHEGRLSSTCAV